MSHGISGHAASVFGFLMALALAPAPGTPLPTAPPAPGNGHGASAPHVAPGQGIAIHEVLFRPSPGRYEWVEMKNIGGAPARIAGFVLSDEDGNVYEFPASTPDVPPGSFVVVVFDGLDSSHNDYDFGDRRIVLHARRGGDLFDDRFDQVALYGGRAEASGEGKPAPARVVAFLAWGAAPEEDGARVADPEVWPEGAYVATSYSAPGKPLNPIPAPDESLGLRPGGRPFFPDDFLIYGSDQVSMGTDNPIPSVRPHIHAGDLLDGETFCLGWEPVAGAVGYGVQMDNDADLRTPEVDRVTQYPAYCPGAPVPDGTYYWRVRAILDVGEGNWSPVVKVRSAIDRSRR